MPLDLREVLVSLDILVHKVRKVHPELQVPRDLREHRESLE